MSEGRFTEDEMWTLIECPDCLRSCWISHTSDCYCGQCRTLMLKLITRDYPPEPNQEINP